MDILAIQTRAQRRRQQQLERADADATAQSGAVITPLHGDSAPLPADRPGREHTDHDSAGRAQKTATPAVTQSTAQPGAVITPLHGDSAPLPADRPGREHTDHESAGRVQNTATPAVNQSPDGDIQQHTGERSEPSYNDSPMYIFLCSRMQRTYVHNYVHAHLNFTMMMAFCSLEESKGVCLCSVLELLWKCRAT